MKSLLTLSSFIVILFWSHMSMASPIAVVNSAGKLIGVNELNVGGALYNVEILRTSCNALYLGCDPALFPFDSFDGAGAAASALLNFIGSDIIPYEVVDSIAFCSRGCALTTIAELQDSFGEIQYRAIDIVIAPRFSLDEWFTSFDGRIGNFSDEITILSWTAVSEPGSLYMLLLGILGLALLFYKKRGPITQ